MRRFLAGSVLVVVAMVATVHSQSKPTPSAAPGKRPDFSGTWVFVRAEDGTGGQGGTQGAVGLGMEFNVAQNDKTLILIGDPLRSAAWNTTFSLDSTTDQDFGSEQVAKISWDGSKLVLLVANPFSTRRQVWALDATGSVLTVETTRVVPPPAADGVVKVVYNKK